MKKLVLGLVATVVVVGSVVFGKNMLNKSNDCCAAKEECCVKSESCCVK